MGWGPRPSWREREEVTQQSVNFGSETSAGKGEGAAGGLGTRGEAI